MPRLTFASLRTRLLLLVLLAVIPALGLAIHTNLQLRRVAAADVKREALGLARIAASDQRDLINNTRQLLFALAQLPDLGQGDPLGCWALLARLLNQYPQHTFLGVASADGELVCSAPALDQPTNLSHKECFLRAIEVGGFASGECLDEPAGGPATLDFGYPVIDQDGQVQGVVLASLDLTWLNQLATEAQLPEGSTITVFDQDGIVLVRYPDPEAWVGRSMLQASIAQAVLARRGEGTAEVPGIDDVPRLFAFTSISGLPAGAAIYVSIGIPAAVAFADVDRLFARELIGLGVVAVLAIGAEWFGGDLFILRRVHRLVDATRRLSAGDLTVRSELPYREGELGQLAHAFDEMAASLERRVAERDRAQEELQRLNQVLEQRVEDRTRELSALYDVMTAASGSLDLETVMDRSLQRTMAVMRCEVGAIHLLDSTGEVLHLAVARGLSPEAVGRAPVPVENGLAGWTIQRGQPMVLSNVASAPRPLLAIPGLGAQAYIGVPMRAKGRALGVLSLVGDVGRAFTDEEVSLLSSIADQVGVAVENARLYQQAEQLAVMRERQRLARELHDSVTQSLYSLVLLAEAGRRLADAGELERVEQALGRLGEIGQQALKEMRLLVYELRPSALRSQGLVRSLQQRLDAVEKRAGVEASLEVDGTLDLPEDVEEQLYRIVQEALNNAIKHAAASAIAVRIRAVNHDVEVVVRDNGRGFDADAVRGHGGMGLVSMRERAEKMSGSLEIVSSPGAGTTVHLRLSPHREDDGVTVGSLEGGR